MLWGITLQASSVVFADSLPQSELDALDDWPNWVAAGNNACSYAGATGGGSASIDPGQQQLQNAEIIMGIAKTDGLNQAGALIALMVGMDESGLRVLANTNVPLSLNNPNQQGTGSNGTSLGIFQQQITDNWSTISSDPTNTGAINQLMTPAYEAEAFFGSPPGSNAPSALSKGLQNVPNWQNMEPWVAAQTVQRSAFSSGLNYQRFLSQAQSLINQYWSAAQLVSLPVATSGGISTGGSAGCDETCNSSTISATATTSNQLQQNVICIAEQELALWKSQPGYNNPYPGFPYALTGFLKYTDNNYEEWCADFVSWVYKQAGDPFTGGDSGGWRLSSVSEVQDLGSSGGKFQWHPTGSGYVPKPGDIAVYGFGHVNIFISSQNGQSTYIGGDQQAPGMSASSPLDEWGGHASGSLVSEFQLSGYYGDNITGYVSPD